MESLLALLITVLAGDVQVDVAGSTHFLAAGEVRVFGADGAVANSLPEFLAAQDDEGKEKKGKKKEGGEEGKEGKKKMEKKEDDDDKEEKGKKDKEKEKDEDKHKEDGPNKKK